MSEDQTRYWMHRVERDTPSQVSKLEFVERPGLDPLASRRTFLKAAGFSFAGALATSCGREPVATAIPYVRQPEGMIPGRALEYASTCGACSARCGVLVTTRDGRPIKIEGNPDHPLSGGATCAAGQASLLGLYDGLRLKHPMRRGQQATWMAVDSEIIAALDKIKADGGAVRFLTDTQTSPTLLSVIGEFLAGFKNARHVVYDTLSTSAILDAHASTHGVRALPRYRFDRADVIVSFDSDFLGTWISPVEFTRGYTSRRRAEAGSPAMSYHVQIESRMSLTGANADRRIRVSPAETAVLLTHLASRIARRAGGAFAAEGITPSAHEPAIDQIAERIWAARGRSLVISGSQDPREQLLCNLINQLAGAYDATLELTRPSYQRQGSDTNLEALRGELTRGEVSALLVAGANPVYDLGGGDALANELRRVPLLVSFADRLDETASLAQYICPDHHYLESWGDAEAAAGLMSLTQPTIEPLAETRALIESVSAWMGNERPALDLIKERWERDVYPRAGASDPFPVFWNRALERGAVEVAPKKTEVKAFNQSAVTPVLRADAPAEGRFLVVLYPTVGMQDGRHGHNPWLHELPDPVTKVTWDNYACLSPADAKRLDVVDGDVVRVASGEQAAAAVELPAFVQVGQQDGVVAIALGYGRAGTDRFATFGPAWLRARVRPGLVGASAAAFIVTSNGARRYAGTAATVTKTGRTRPLASTQMHHSLAVPASLEFAAGGIEPRPIVRETTWDELRAPEHESQHEEVRDLWPPDHPRPTHRWGMSIDLSSCTGCSACVVACQVENNVPVVGQDEVRRQREMHWIRIDRYYSGGDDEVSVAHQPMLCQQCGHAPCETVCPVLATVHSEEGLNEQVYNRCVGTRYCANNCPYKVRRFNWFDYPHEDQLLNLGLNPSVTVRSRGVMEKCTFCVQRIEEAKIEARRTGQPIADGSLQTACQQVCPAQAIVFGDLNDPKSRVARLVGDPRAYSVLGELNTQPSVRYLTLVRNRPAAERRRDG